MMKKTSSNIAIDDTCFIFRTNFSGDPERDPYGDSRRKVNILIPNPDQAKDLLKQGFKIRQTRPRSDEDAVDFVPEYFVPAILKYRTKNGVPVKYPPKVYLVSGDGEPRLLDENSVSCIDNMRVSNVNVILNPYEYDPANGGKSLYIRTIYVEQSLDDDPYAARYAQRAAASRYAMRDEEEADDIVF